jgi:hypothetical protein
MNTQTVTSWILLSYFAPFATFFFGIFWLGLNIWMFILGTFVVSMMTLFLYLAFKNWQVQMSQQVTQIISQAEVRKIPAVTVLKEHPLTKLVTKSLDLAPICTLALCEQEHLQDIKSSYTRLQEEHMHIVEAYEKEREKLFGECAKQNDLLKKGALLQKENQTALDDAETTISQLECEIENLKFEIKTLLKMDQEQLIACVSEEQFLR